MIDKAINALIAGIIGAVAFVAVKSLLDSAAIYGNSGNYTWGAPTNPVDCEAYTLNASNGSACTWYEPTVGDIVIHNILPLAIAIMVITGLFMGLTRIRGV